MTLCAAGGQSRLHATPPRRFVYLDVGANWANTLRLHADIGCFANESWEVYAFEPSPMIWGYLEDFTRWLNGHATQRPRARVAGGASGVDLVSTFAAVYGCQSVQKPTYGGKTEQWRRAVAESERCIERSIQPVVADLSHHYRKELNSTALLLKRLARARSSASHGLSRRSRYTFVPAAAGVYDGWLDLPAIHTRTQGQLFTRPRNLSVYQPGIKRERAVAVQRAASSIRVPTVDFGAWLESSFSEADWVVLKIDAEGAEHDVMPAILNAPARRRLVDALFWECHESEGGRPCKELTHEISRLTRLTPVANPERDSASEGEIPQVLAELRREAQRVRDDAPKTT